MSTPNQIKVLIVDDLERVRQGLRTVLELADGLAVVGEASNGLEAIEQVERLVPDVVLMDLAMPMMDGLEATRRIKAQHPETAVVMITIHDSDKMRELAEQAGADAFVLKGASTEALLKAIRTA